MCPLVCMHNLDNVEGGGAEGGVSLLINFQKGVAWQDLRQWMLGKIGVTFFRGFADFAKKKLN